MEGVIEGKKRKVMKVGMAYAINREEELMEKQCGVKDYALNNAKRQIAHSILIALMESEIEWREFITKTGERAVEGVLFIARKEENCK